MIWHSSLDALRDALADLYATEADARRIAATAGLDLKLITFDAKTINAWQSILGEGMRRRRVDSLMDLALEEYSDNLELQAACADCRDWLSKQAAAGLGKASQGQSSAKQRYRERVSSWYCELRPVDEEPTKESDLDQAFFLLPMRPEHPKDQDQSNTKPALARAIEQNERLALLGEVGAGKSTTLCFLALCFGTQGWAKERLGLDREYIPVFLELSTIAAEKAPTLKDSLVRTVSEFAQVEDPEALGLLDQWRREDGLIILLDGLDEVPDARRYVIAEEIRRLADSWAGPGCHMVVSSRPESYVNLGPQFAEYSLRPFSSVPEARPYVARWLRVLGGRPEEAEELLRKMAEHDGLRHIIGNPLLLYMAIKLYVRPGGTLVQNEATLYDDYIEKKLWKRAEERATPATAPKLEEALKALEEIAWLRQTRGSAPETLVKEALRAKLPGLGALELLRFLQRAMGILTWDEKTAPHMVDFTRPVFCQYFVAKRLCKHWNENPQGAWAFLRPRLHDPDWRESLLLLVGMLDDQNSTMLVQHVLRAHSPYEAELHRDLRLAASLGGRATQKMRRATIDRILRRFGWWLSPTRKWLRAWPPICLFLVGIGLAFYGLPWYLACPIALVFVLFLLQRMLYYFEIDLGPTLSYLVRRFTFTYRVSLVHQAFNHLPAWHSVLELLTRPFGLLRDRSLLVGALAELRHARSLGILLRALDDRDPDVRNSAADALGRLRDRRAVDPLIDALDRGNALQTDLANYAAKALREIGDPQAVEPLVDAIWHGHNWRALDDEVRALGKLGDARAAKALIMLLDCGDDEIIREAYKALVRIGPPVVEDLIHALDDDEQTRRHWAVEALGEIGDLRAVDPLLRASDNLSNVADALARMGAKAIDPLIDALDNVDASVRACATMALGRIDDARTMAPLIRMACDPEYSVRGAAIEGLRRWGAKVVGPLLDTAYDEEKKGQYVMATAPWAELGPDVFEPFIAALDGSDWELCRTIIEKPRLAWPQPTAVLLATAKEHDGDSRQNMLIFMRALGCPPVRPNIVRALGQHKDIRAASALVSALDDSDPLMRSSAAWALGELGDAQGVEPLIGALADSDWCVSAKAAEALGKLGDAGALPALLQVLMVNKDSAVGESAVKALGALGPAAIEPLLSILKNPNVRLRKGAAQALGRLKDSRAIAPLVQTLDDPDYHVRSAVIEALGQIADVQVVAPLLLAVGSRSHRRTALDALVRLADVGVIRTARGAVLPIEPLLAAWDAEGSSQTCITIARILEQLADPRTVESLIRALEYPDAKVREHVSAALAQIGAEAVPPLVRALDSSEWRVREGAVKALGQITDDSRALDALIRAMGDEHLGSAAAEALVQFGPQAMERLTCAAQERNRVIRRRAVRTLGELGDIRSVRPLLRASRDRDPSTRVAAVLALGDMANSRALQELDEEESQRWSKRIVRALRRRLVDTARSTAFLASVEEAAYPAFASAVNRLAILESLAAPTDDPLAPSSPPSWSRLIRAIGWPLSFLALWLASVLTNLLTDPLHDALAALGASLPASVGKLILLGAGLAVALVLFVVSSEAQRRAGHRDQ